MVCQPLLHTAPTDDAYPRAQSLLSLFLPINFHDKSTYSHTRFIIHQSQHGFYKVSKENRMPPRAALSNEGRLFNESEQMTAFLGRQIITLINPLRQITAVLNVSGLCASSLRWYFEKTVGTQTHCPIWFPSRIVLEGK